MLFFLCFRPTIKFQGGSPVDPLFEPPSDPPFDSTSQNLFLLSFRRLWINRQPNNRYFLVLEELAGNKVLSGPVRDTLPYRAIPLRDSIAEGAIAPNLPCFQRVSRSYRWDTPFEVLRGGYRTSTSHALQGGKRSEKGEGVSHPIGHVETPKTP